MIPLATSNRHGLIAGTTGTGKSVTLMHLSGEWVRAGVPVVVVDCKGDLTKLTRVTTCMTLPQPTIPVGEFSPLEFADILTATDAGASLLIDVWRAVDSAGRALVTLADLLAALTTVPAARLAATGILDALRRQIVRLQESGADALFRAPAFNVESLVTSPPIVSRIDAKRIVRRPRMYNILFDWMADEMMCWPEVGDVCRLVMLVDEAHLLFESRDHAQRMLTAIRMLRSRGVGCYFSTQSPEDLPEKLLALLGHKIIHAIRLFTPSAVKRARVLAAECGVRVDKLSALGTGEAVTSILQADGRPALWSGMIAVGKELI